jgi:hypothetical protein
MNFDFRFPISDWAGRMTPLAWWGETLSSPVCRPRRREQSEHLGVAIEDAHSVRLAPLDSGLDRVSPHPVTTGCMGQRLQSAFANRKSQIR